jgi:hypothetical protein
MENNSNSETGLNSLLPYNLFAAAGAAYRHNTLQ